MDRITLKSCISTIEQVIGTEEQNWTVLLDVFREFTSSESDLAYVQRHIINFNDTTWGEEFLPFLLPNDGSEINLARFLN